jgi:hypothetical protein
MYCETYGCEDINLALIYFDLANEQEYPLEEIWSAIELKEYCESLAEKYCHWQFRNNIHYNKSGAQCSFWCTVSLGLKNFVNGKPKSIDV